MPNRADYLDFELAVTRSGDGQYVTTARIEGGLGEGQQVVASPFAPEELAAWPGELRRLARGMRNVRVGEARPALDARQFGQRLFDGFIRDKVQILYVRWRELARERGQALRLRLIIEAPELVALPWELLCDTAEGRGKFLSLDEVSIVRYRRLLEPTRPLPVKPPLRVLAMAAVPRGTQLPELDIAAERRWIEEALGDRTLRGTVELSWVKGPRWRDLQEELERGPWHVFHFIGHGTFDPGPGEGYLALEDDAGGLYRLSADQLGQFLKPHPPHSAPGLVVLNACSGAEGSPRDPSSSMAATLATDIPAVLAMQCKISDQAAVEFARTFYRVLARGDAVDAALGQAREALRAAAPSSDEWGTPVLYMRSQEGYLFGLARPFRTWAIAAACVTALMLLPAGLLLHARGCSPSVVASRDAGAALALDMQVLRSRALAALTQGLEDGDPTLRRQAVAALAESRDIRYWSMLKPLLRDPDFLVQARVAEALGQLGARAALPVLKPLLAAEIDESVQVEAAGALMQLLDPRGQEWLHEALARDAVGLRAALLLAGRGDRAAVAQLRRALAQVEPEQRVPILERLATLDPGPAQDQLAVWLLAEDVPDARKLAAAAGLARLGDRRGQEFLVQAARRPGALQLPAARVLTTLPTQERFAGLPLLRAVLDDAAQPWAARLLAAEGLGACGDRDSAQRLAGLLPAVPAQLRIGAAGALLLISGQDQRELTEQGLSWARAALGDDSARIRETAPPVLGDAEPGETVGLLGRMLATDPDAEVRRRAAGALARKRQAAAQTPLLPALSDGSPEVRAAVLQAIGSVAAPAGAAAQELIQRLVVLTRSEQPTERLRAGGALTRLGDGRGQEILRQGLTATDPELRALAVSEAGPDLDQAALSDTSFRVRFTAAQKLAGRGSQAAAPVLLEGLSKGGTDALVAYALLRRLGQPIERPAALDAALGAPDGSTRALAVRALAPLPTDEALPLLRRVAHDPDLLVRRAAAEVAADRPAELRGLLRALLADPDGAVRARAAVLLARLPPEAVPKKIDDEPPEVVDQPPATPDAGPPAAPDAGTQSAPQPGHLSVKGEAQVRVQLDNGPWRELPLRAVEVAPGPHKVRWAGGEKDFAVSSGGKVVVRVPLSVAQQALLDGLKEYQARAYDKARQLLERAHRLGLEHPPRAPDFWDELLYHLGSTYEALVRLPLAMTSYEEYGRRVPAGRRRHQAAVNEALRRLAPRLGRIRVSKLVGGKCEVAEMWTVPGEQVLDGTRVQVRAGETVAMGNCKGGVR